MMIGDDELAGAVRRLRRAAPPDEGRGALAAPLGLAEIEQLLPHRAPMLLLAAIDAIDLAAGTIAGRLHLHDGDPVFAGHFPGDPVYPGVLLVEAMGQLGLCLCQLRNRHGGAQLAAKFRATRIHHAAFFEPVTPGAPVTLRASLVEDDGLLLVAGGQAYQRDRLCAISILEVFADDA